MTLMKGIWNNKSFIIFVCISGASLGCFFLAKSWIHDNDGLSIAGTIFFSANGYWLKTKFELEKKSKEIIDLEGIINESKTILISRLDKSLEKLEIENNAANKIQDEKFDNLKTNLTRLEASFNNHQKAVGHLESEKRLSELTANVDLLRLNLSQIAREQENRKKLNQITREQKRLQEDYTELKGFMESHGFKVRHHVEDDLIEDD